MTRTARIAALTAALSLLAAAPAGKLTGALHLTFSLIIPSYPMPSMLYYGCVGDTKFTASPVKK
jgi:hypothetical protein